MTVLTETMVQPAPLQTVIDQSMTVLAETMVQPAPLQTVIDQSMTNFEAVPVGVGQCRESLTSHFDYGYTTYGQMSLITVNDKNLWTKLKKKMSFTIVNDKKIVIY